MVSPPLVPADGKRYPFETRVMIDREARNDLVALIRGYLAEEIKAFDIDEQLERFRDSSDSGGRFVATTMWFHYDDCKDHLVVASKPQCRNLSTGVSTERLGVVRIWHNVCQRFY